MGSTSFESTTEFTLHRYLSPPRIHLTLSSVDASTVDVYAAHGPTIPLTYETQFGWINGEPEPY